MATQLGFDLPARTALGRDDFMIAPSNAVAVAMIDDWRRWPAGKLALSGPTGSGKTHLAHVWAEQCGGQIVDAATLTDDNIVGFATGPVAVEDVDTIAPDMPAQTALFHLHNLLLAAGTPLLMTGTAAPTHWHMTLPDLQSRIAAAGHAALDAPDDSLLTAVIAKLFADRQLTPRPDVIPYLLPRMERSFVAAQRLVTALDAASLARKQPVTRALAATVLDKDTPNAG
ncbi:chromosomal replication initiator DnaA [uncultured Tateyamaria sp.]|uniref:chromosomal replication initiator DnaA n=1 Tax=uncultured Tateyamaria sp. TaxID=455651 RepID=UPI00260180EC|nr:chromosomal replication initiator DnaA [uncultured Tateyamaria sp.]